LRLPEVVINLREHCTYTVGYSYSVLFFQQTPFVIVIYWRKFVQT